MAVVPTLAAMAALTLFQHPEAQPEDVSVDYSAFSAPAITIQRFVRGIISRVRTLIPPSRRMNMQYPWDSYAHRGRRYWMLHTVTNLQRELLLQWRLQQRIAFRQ